MKAATPSSNSATLGPVVSQSERRVSATAAHVLVIDELAAVGDERQFRHGIPPR